MKVFFFKVGTARTACITWVCFDTKFFRKFQPTTVASIVVKYLLTSKKVQGILASDALASIENTAA